MSDDLFLLSNDDILLLRDMARAFKQRGRNPYGRPALGEDDLPNASDVYLARTPAAGIAGPSQTGTGSGSVAISDEVVASSASCYIFQLLPSGHLQHVSDFKQTVYAINAVEGDSWVLVARTKYGDWWVVEVGLGPDEAWLSVPIAVPQDVTLAGGSTFPMFAATTYTYIGGGSGFNGVANSAWWWSVGANLGSPPQRIIRCKKIDEDVNGKPIYSEASEPTTIWLPPTELSTPGPGSFTITTGLGVDNAFATSRINEFQIDPSVSSDGLDNGGIVGAKLVWSLSGSGFATGQPTGLTAIQWNGFAPISEEQSLLDPSSPNSPVSAFVLEGAAYDTPGETQATFGISAGSGNDYAMQLGLYWTLFVLNPLNNHTYMMVFSGGLLTKVLDVTGAGTGTGSGGSGRGPIFPDLCPGQQFNKTYTLTISGTCSAINGTYTITWNGGEWTWTGVISGVTVEFIIADNSGVPAFYMDENGGGALSALNNATSYTCPPTFTANGTATLVGVGHIPLCPAATVNWSVS